MHANMTILLICFDFMWRAVITYRSKTSFTNVLWLEDAVSRMAKLAMLFYASLHFHFELKKMNLAIFTHLYVYNISIHNDMNYQIKFVPIIRESLISFLVWK